MQPSGTSEACEFGPQQQIGMCVCMCMCLLKIFICSKTCACVCFNGGEKMEEKVQIQKIMRRKRKTVGTCAREIS